MVSSSIYSDKNNISIHTTVKIGVAGPEIITEYIKDKIKEVFQNLDQKLDSTPHDYIIFAPIDEPDDRVVAEIICGLYDPPKDMNEVFSQKKDYYINEFSKDDDKEEFKRKLDAAINSQNQDSEEYRYIWKYVVHKSHLMIIIWDGVSDSIEYEQARRIHKYAKNVGRSFFMINPETLEITENPFAYDGTLDSLENLNDYNKEEINFTTVKEKARDKYQSIIEKAEKSQFQIPPDSSKESLTEFLKPLDGFLLIEGARASLLSAKYRKKHLNAVDRIAKLSLFAVAVVAFQVLFFPELYILIILEIFAISYIFYILYISQSGEWHRKWIDYRFLAECLRAYNFLYITGMKFKKLDKTPVHLSLAHRPDEWMLRAFEWISDEQTRKKSEIIPIDEIEKIKQDIKPNLFDPLKNFLLNAWITDQINFYDNKQELLLAKHEKNYRWGLCFFILTWLLAAIHLLAGFSHEIVPNLVEKGVIFLLISLPAATAALTAIRVQNEYQKNSKRYKNTSSHLKKVKAEIEQTKTLKELTEQIEEANEIMLREHQDWRVVFIFRELEPP